MVKLKERLVSLDVFRGLTMACMILVENPGNWHIYKPLRHASWGMLGKDGLPFHQSITPTDLIMPFFLFIVGVSIVFGKMIAYGVNCISVYFVSHIVSSTLHVIRIGSGRSAVSLHKWINVNWFHS